MKLVVFGATGGIGSQVVEQALAAGHEVTEEFFAMARRHIAIMADVVYAKLLYTIR